MDDKVNYALVGAFVLALGAALVVAVLWLSAGMGGKQEMDRYQAFIEESVAGLNVDAPVKYLGVDVGKVGRIEIDPGNPLRVRLSLLIKSGTPIRQDSVGVLRIHGLTGIAYVEISGGSQEASALVAGADGAVPTITFKPSLSARLENVLGAVLGDLARMSDNLNAVFDDDNRAAFATMLADTAALAHALAAHKDALGATLADAARTAHLTARAGEQLAPVLERIASGAQAVERMAAAAEAASARAGLAADAAASGVQRLDAEILPEVARLLGELNELSVSLQRLSEQTASNPGSLLVGRAPPRPGPGERPPP